jgi:hypothetical protein
LRIETLGVGCETGLALKAAEPSAILSASDYSLAVTLVPLTCDSIRDQLVEFLLGEPKDDAALEALIHAHIKECRSCEPAAREFAEALVILALSAPECPAPRECRIKVLSSLERREVEFDT